MKLEKPCKIGEIQEFALFISNGNPFTAGACVKNIRVAVVVSVPKSLNKASAFVFKSSSTRT